MAEITQLLGAIRAGDSGALDSVFDLIYPQLKQLAAAQMMVKPGQTLTPTTVVNETYLKFSQADRLDLVDRRHFMVCAARAMRHIVIDHARAASAKRRGGDRQRVTLSSLSADQQEPLDALDLDRAMAELNAINPALHQLVELRFFGGLTMSEIAELLDCSLSTVNRNWVRARALLNSHLTE